MNYKQTQLWKAAFVEPHGEASSEEQVLLAGHYDAMRTRASALVARISADLPFLTVHDVTHLDALWEMASIACGEKITLNPAEAFVFGGAVLLHDAAMSLASFPGGLEELKTSTEWRDSHAQLVSTLNEEQRKNAQFIEERATESALRLIHAKHAENLPRISWIGPAGDQMHIIENHQLRHFYGPKIGKIAYSHWWSIARTEQELSGTLGGLPGICSCTVDLLKIACLLRVADAMHLDQRRAPAFEFAIIQPTGIASQHWKFQQRMAKPFIQGDALVYTAQPAFELENSDAWWTAFDALQTVDRELRNVDRVLRDHQKTALAVRRVEGVQSPTDLARTVETSGWIPVDSTLRITNVPKIITTLGGEKLYGNNLDAPIRELIQNSLDAIAARRRLQNRPNDWGEINISLDTRPDGHWLAIEDNGVGMSLSVLTGPLIDFGNSFWRSTLAAQEFPGLLSSGMNARGKYGIGFFATFMLGNEIRVISRRFDKDIASGKILEFKGGIASRPNVRDASPNETPIDGGTRIEIKLKSNPSEEGGILHFHQTRLTNETHSFDGLITSIAPAVDVKIRIFQNEKLLATTQPADWLEIKGDDLLLRINKNLPLRSKNTLPLATIQAPDGTVFGRARIEAGDSFSYLGMVVVDGLSSTKIPSISGILLGAETTASRNEAKPIVPPKVLAKWASTQAQQIFNSKHSNWAKMRASSIILACGGDIGSLPILHLGNGWINIVKLKELAPTLAEIVIHEGDISHSDSDPVTIGDFDDNFEQNTDIATIANPNFFGSWIAFISKHNMKTPLDIIRIILEQIWPSLFEATSDVVVGTVNGRNISRDCIVFSRSE